MTSSEHDLKPSQVRHWPPQQQFSTNTNNSVGHAFGTDKPTVQVHPMRQQQQQQQRTKIETSPTGENNNVHQRSPGKQVLQAPAPPPKPVHLSGKLNVGGKKDGGGGEDERLKRVDDSVKRRDMQRERLSREDESVQRLSTLIVGHCRTDGQLKNILATNEVHTLTGGASDGNSFERPERKFSLECGALPINHERSASSSSASMALGFSASSYSLAQCQQQQQNWHQSNNELLFGACGSESDLRLLPHLYPRKYTCSPQPAAGASLYGSSGALSSASNQQQTQTQQSNVTIEEENKSEAPDSFEGTSILGIKGEEEDEEMRDLERKKVLDLFLPSSQRELIASLSRKMGILREEREAIDEEMRSNERVGSELRRTFARCGFSPTHLSKFDTLCAELDTAEKLLIRLQAQLKRIDQATQTIGEGSEAEKRLLTARRRRCADRLTEANELSNHVQKRAETLLDAAKRLVGVNEETVNEFNYFLAMKRSLLREAAMIEEKLQLGADQLNALEATLMKS